MLARLARPRRFEASPDAHPRALRILAPGLLALLGVTAPAAAQGDCPALVDVTVLAGTGVFEDWPAAGFSDAAGIGVILWSESFGSGCTEYQTLMFSEWNGSTWSAPTSVPGQAPLARHKRQTFDFRPGTADGLVAYHTSTSGVTCFDEVGSRFLDGGAWDAVPTMIGDGVDDDDTTGNLRFAADGSYALCVWGDSPGLGSTKLGLSCNVWDSVAGTWGPEILVQDTTGALPSSHQRDNRSLIYDDLDDAWILVYQKREDTAAFDPTRNEIAWQRGTGSAAGVTFAGEVQLTSDLVEDDRPIVAKRPNGEIACFFTRYVGGNGELAASLWDPVSDVFLPPVVLTTTAVDEFVEAAVGTDEGWEILFLATPQGETDREVYYARFDGSVITDSFRLTRDGLQQRHTDAAVDNLGRTHVVWSADGDILTGRIDFGPERVPSFCDGYDGSLASCPCGNAGDPGAGCDVVQGTGGVSLCLTAQESVPENRVTMSGTGFPTTASPSSIVIRSDQLEGATPVVFGDGLRCVGTPLVRLAATFATNGVATHTFGHGTSAGPGSFYYQLWFRNTPTMYCTPAAFNLSNGRRLDW